jgi:hypothetical protein
MQTFWLTLYRKMLPAEEFLFILLQVKKENHKVSTHFIKQLLN